MSNFGASCESISMFNMQNSVNFPQKMRRAYFLCLRINSLFNSLFCIVLEVIVLMKKILHSLENFTQLILTWYSKSLKTSYLIPKYDIPAHTLAKHASSITDSVAWIKEDPCCIMQALIHDVPSISHMQ